MLLSLITPTPPDHQHGMDTTVTDTDTCFRHPPPTPPVRQHGMYTTVTDTDTCFRHPPPTTHTTRPPTWQLHHRRSGIPRRVSHGRCRGVFEVQRRRRRQQRRVVAETVRATSHHRAGLNPSHRRTSLSPLAPLHKPEPPRTTAPI
jgi:hypothetical protein